MKKYNLGTGALVGTLTTAPLVGAMYLANQLTGLPFVPFDLFDWLTRVLPGPLITFGIDLMISMILWMGVDVAETAKAAEQFMAVVQFFAGGIMAGVIFFGFLSARKVKADFIAGIVIAALFGLPMVTISIAIGLSTIHPILRILWLVFLFLVWGFALSWAYRRLMSGRIEELVEVDESHAVERVNRRQFLIRLGTVSAAITVVGAGVGALVAHTGRRRLEQALDDSMAHRTDTSKKQPFPNMDDPVMPAPGTRPEYTPIKDHYSVFIRTEPTVIDGSTWVLPITGLVDNPLMLTLEDIKKKYKSRDQYVTLSCISGQIGSSLIGTTMWTGVSLQDILTDAQVRSEARYIYISAGDGFYETVDLDLIAADRRIMLCYAWDGHELPVKHGYPLRIWLPDRYGMKQPRWITGIEIIDEYRKGYWVKRNWDEIAQVKTTSVIDTVAVNAVIKEGNQNLVPIGGIAFSGARGISRVEVRVDTGPWQEAKLRSPLSETSWVIWRFDWSFEEGEHIFEVRCAEADGTPQIEDVQSNRPSGATGIHNYEETV
jgi:DMSO/TMAO reductase YedYZ molybdopterin-dependent catalytic subunit